MEFFGAEGFRRENTSIEGYKILKQGSIVRLVRNPWVKLSVSTEIVDNAS